MPLMRMILGDRPCVAVAVLMLAVTALLIASHVVLAAIGAEEGTFAAKLFWQVKLGIDGTLGERYMHGLAFASALLFLVTALHVRSRVLGFLALVFGFVWFDDSSRYHETAGLMLAQAGLVRDALGVSAKNVGQIVAWGAVGLALLPVLFWAWAGRRPGDSGVLVAVGAAFGLLALFGAGADWLSVAVPREWYEFVAVIEDGGEIVMASVVAALAIGICRNGDRIYAPFHAPVGGRTPGAR